MIFYRDLQEIKEVNRESYAPLFSASHLYAIWLTSRSLFLFCTCYEMIMTKPIAIVCDHPSLKAKLSVIWQDCQTSNRLLYLISGTLSIPLSSKQENVHAVSQIACWDMQHHNWFNIKLENVKSTSIDLHSGDTFSLFLSIFYISQRLTLWYFVFLYLIFLSQQVLYFLLSTLVLTLYIDVVLSLSNRYTKCLFEAFWVVKSFSSAVFSHIIMTNNGKICGDIWEDQRSLYEYRKISNIRRTKTQNLNNSRLVLRLSRPNIVNPGVKARMKM